MWIFIALVPQQQMTLLIGVVFGVACLAAALVLKLRLPSHRKVFEKWADKNGFTVEAAGRRFWPWSQGPFGLWNGLYVVFRITVLDRAGHRKEGFARVGGFFTGLGDEVTVAWDRDVQESWPYGEVPLYTDDEIRSFLEAGEYEDLLFIPLSVALYHEDRALAESILVGLAEHPDPNVRGNALRGFGHLARRFGTLDAPTATPLIEAGLRSDDKYVRDQAREAADEIAQFLNDGIGSHPKRL